MKLYNSFNQYFLFIYLFLLITICYGQEHHNDYENLKSTVIIDSSTQDIQNPKIHPNIIEKSSNDVVSENKIKEDNQLTSKPTQIDMIQHNHIEKDILISPAHSFQEENIVHRNQDQQICWRLPKTFQSTIEFMENQTLYFINSLPEFIQTILFERVDNREILINTILFDSICIICFLFSIFVLIMGIKRLKQYKCDREIRTECQQLRQYNDQVEFENITIQRKNQKLLSEMDEMKSLSLRYEDDIEKLRLESIQLNEDLNTMHIECDTLRKDVDCKQNLIQKHEFDIQKQMDIVAHLNNEILEYQRVLEKEREIIARLQSNDLSLERFEKLQETIHELKSEIIQLKQEKFTQIDQLQEVQEHAKQLNIDNNELTIKMKQLKDLLEQKDETISRIRQTMLNNNDDDEEKIIGDLFSTVRENSPDNDEEQQQLLLTIDNNVEKASQHMRDLLSEMEEKSHRIKEFDLLLNQEKDRCRELETKLKVVLELRERDAHLHIRQLGQTDAELRKARTDTERVRILQQQLELKQQQLDDVQKVLTSEQTKFSEECSKLQHETHEKWMEVKRLTRELDGARKECESLRKQITKYANSERSSQEKTMLKPVPQHINNAVSDESDTNGSSSPSALVLLQQEERSIDYNSGSSATSPVNMFRTKPPLFAFPRPCFRPPPFIPSFVPSRLMLSSRFPMPVNDPQKI